MPDFFCYLANVMKSMKEDKKKKQAGVLTIVSCSKKFDIVSFFNIYF